MPDDRSQQILSSWVKRPVYAPPASNNTASRQQWSKIFKKPAKPLDEEKEDTDTMKTEEQDTQTGEIVAESKGNEDVGMPKKKKRHLNPYNPFNSFVATMKAPPNLQFPLPRSSLIVKLRTPSLSSSPAASQVSEPSSQPTQLTSQLSSQPPSQPPSQPQLADEDAKRIQSSRGDSQDSSKPSTQKKAFTSFFAKRPTKGAAAKGVSTSSTPFRPKLPPYELVHVRPEQSWSHCLVNKRHMWNRSFCADTWQSLVPVKPARPDEYRAAPQRRVIDGEQLDAIVMRFRSPPSLAQTRELVASEADAFDCGRFETKMWCEKYAPSKPVKHVSPKSAEAIRTWLKTRPSKPTAPRKRTKTALDGLVVDDDDTEDEGSALLLVQGASGSGKTSAVYAAAQSLGYFVFEINASMKRTGKELSSMLEGISRNHAVHSAKKVVILVDDADIVYENEAGTFWPTIIKFANVSRRPVVITCSDPSLLALPSTTPFETVDMTAAELTVTADLAWIIALKEGHLLDKDRVLKLCAELHCDLRRVLTTLQFWCQYGLEGHPSGLDWVPKLHEIAGGKRIISDGTWFEIPSEQPPELGLGPLGLEPLSEPAAGQPLLDEVCVRSSEDNVWPNTALALSQWIEPTYKSPELAYMRPLQTAVDPYFFYSSPTRGRNLSLDIAPYLRHMVVSDTQRQLSKKTALANLSGREQRMVTRSMRDAGVDTRNYLGLGFGTMASVLHSGFQK